MRRHITQFCSLALFCASTWAATPPNIVFVLTDDHRWDMMSTANTIIKTPNMTTLAQAGINFTHAYTTTPICFGSRPCILTGLWERTHGNNAGTPNVASQYAWYAYPKILKEHGYATALIGKYGTELVNPAFRDSLFTLYDDVGRFQSPSPYMFTYNGKITHLTDVETDKALNFIRANYKTKPFCVQVNYHAPHADDGLPEQYVWPPAFDSFYVKDVIPPARIGDTATFKGLPLFLQNCEAHNRWKWRFNEPAKYQTMMKGYFKMISNIDSCIGLMRHTLDSLGIADNTVFILTGDNGMFLGERQMADKFLGWEEALRVPLFIYDPRTTAQHGVTNTNIALGVDIAPTIVELAGINIPTVYQGKSLYPFLTGANPAWRDEFYFEQRAAGILDPMYGVRTPQWKYVIFDKQPVDNEQLYDLKNDPGEITNLVKNSLYTAALTQMRQKALRYRDSLAHWPVDGNYYMDQWESNNQYENFNVDSALTYSGTWARQTNNADYDGGVQLADSSGEFVQYSFTGKSMIKVGIRKGPSGGICKVYLDGALVLDNYDSYSATAMFRQVIFSDSTLTAGPHVIRLVATGQKRTNASGSALMFDFFLVKNFAVTTKVQGPVASALPGFGINIRGTSSEIVLNHAGTGTVTVKLFSLSGELLLERAVPLHGEETKVSIGIGPRQKLKPGIYLCTIYGTTFGRVTKRFVIFPE